MSRWMFPFVCLVLGALVGGFVVDRSLQGQNPAAPALAIPKDLTSYRDVVKRVLPAVVSIEAKAKPKVKPMNQPKQRRQPNLDDSRIPEEFRRFFDDFGAAPFQQFDSSDEAPRQGFGSGFLVDAKGVILTNNHVVDGADQVEVTLLDGRKFVSKDIKGDPKTDLAIVRIEGKDLPHLELGDSDAMEIGDRVLAVGAPFGLTGSVTQGIISGKARHGLRMSVYEDYLQTDAAINPGNSGGPLVSLDGRVIGINAAIKSRSGGFQGVGLAVSSNLSKNVMQQLLENGVVRRGYLGVQIKDIDADVAARLGVTGKAISIAQVFDGSPAAKAGIQAGDVLTTLNGKAIKDGRDLQNVVAGLAIGKPVEVKVVRDGKTVTLKVTIEEQPQDFGTSRTPAPPPPQRNRDAVAMDKIGMSVSDLTPELAEKLGMKATEGALISQVEGDGVAGLAGLSRGMVVTKVDQQPVKSAVDFRQAMEKASLEKGVLLQVQAPRGSLDYVLLKATETTRK